MLNTPRARSRVLALLLSLALVATACGGDDGGGSSGDLEIDLRSESVTGADLSGDADGGSADDGSADGNSSGAAAAPGGPITGPLYTTGSFGSGLFAFDAATGQATELETDLVDFIDRNRDPVVVGDAAYMIGATTRPDSSFANDLSLLRLDLATGEFTSLAELGFDRENDDDSNWIQYELEGAGGNSVYVSSRDGSSDDTIWRHFDATTGAEVASYLEPNYDITDANGGTCSQTLSPIVTADGGLIALADGIPTVVDPLTGTIAGLPAGRDCGSPDISIAEFVDAAGMDAFSTYRDGVAVPWTEVDEFFWPDISGGFSISSDFVEGDGSLWWVFQDSLNTENLEGLVATDSLIMGVVQWDPVAETVVQVIPLGQYAGEFLGLNENDIMEIRRPQLELQWIDGRLAMIDNGEDAPTLLLDPASGTVTEVVYDLGEGNDFLDVELQPTRSGELWVTVKRSVIESDDDTGRFSTGQFFSERIDPATGTILESWAWAGF